MKDNDKNINNEDKFFIPDDYKPLSYEVSEGVHLGYLCEHYWVTDESGQRDLRLVFAVEDMPCDRFTYLVAATYRTQGQREVLTAMLTTWLGDQLHLFLDEDGAVDFKRLIKTKHPVMLTIRFYNDGNHTTPFRSIKALNRVRRPRKANNCPRPVRAPRHRRDDRLDEAA